ncbi:hypothetical protein KEM56_000798 [Ascosphaera pollenicola]|nr:hypothetical protein KEM56_000798 [Ascosphaera pollenicola]
MASPAAPSPITLKDAACDIKEDVAATNLVTTASQQQQEQQRSPRPKRPNFKRLHRFPLPIQTYPLPPLIPHNPLSWATIALTYLFQLISPPSRKRYSAYFDPLTSSVHVTDHDTIRALWEMGFFGKGSLSRSEPSWMDREKKRLGLIAGSTAEEVTKARRNERREMKLERARKEREAIAVQLRLEAEKKAMKGDVGGSASSGELVDQHSKAEAVDDFVEVETVDGAVKADAEITESATSMNVVAEETVSVQQSSQTVQHTGAEEEMDLQNEEHLQLSLEEAFFLVYGLGVLNVYSGPNTDDASLAIISAPSLFALFRRFSYSPSRDALLPREPDDRFIVSYVVYHHFRSLGWVVRSGVKFGVDYILYNRGPVFSHAEFAVVVLPSYSHSYWTGTENARRTQKSWWWLHCVNRVQAQVKKTLVLCYVEIPPPSQAMSAEEELDIGEQLKAYRVREFSIRRWVPNRTRD